MPYIVASQRTKLDPIIEELAAAIAAEAVDGGDECAAAGMLNYSITRMIGLVFHTLFSRAKYWHHALIAGILANVQHEVYRRMTVPYEDLKISNNGDLSEFES